MIIEIKAIKNKLNEWMPQDRIYLDSNKIEEIIFDEDLKNNMIKKQGVIFISETQTFSNVVFNAKDYNNELIFLIKNNQILKNREYYFAYVVGKSWNTSEKVVLDLKIDNITSNYDLFENGLLAGQTYIERSNNFERNVNNIHSDTCASITNIVPTLTQTSNKVNTDITHIVINNDSLNATTKTLNEDPKTLSLMTPVGGDVNTIIVVNGFNQKGSKVDTVLLDRQIATANPLYTAGHATYKLGSKISNIQNVIMTGIDPYTGTNNKISVHYNNGTESPHTGARVLPFKNIGGIVTNQNGLLNINPLQVYETRFEDMFKDDDIIDNVLAKFSTSKFQDKTWVFKSAQDIDDFINTLTVATRNNQKYLDVLQLIQDNRTLKWYSIPKIFDMELDSNSLINTFKISLPELQYNLKDHLFMHYDYNILIGKLFNISLDLAKIRSNENPVLYGTRYINNDNIKYSFYYDELNTDLISELTISPENGLAYDEYNNYLREKSISYESQIKTNLNASIGQSFLNLGLGGVGGFFLGGAGKAIGNILTGGLSGLIGSLANLGFNEYKRQKEQYYKELELQNKPIDYQNIPLYDAVHRIIFNTSNLGRIYMINEASTVDYGNISVPAYLMGNNNKIQVQDEYNYIQLQIIKPLQDDIDIIVNDQAQFGNVVNQYFINKDNVLEFPSNKDHLYFQGNILPNQNPVDSFTLTDITSILKEGIKIFKSSDQFNVIFTSNGDFIINQFLEGDECLTDVTVNSSNNDLRIISS